MEEQIKQIYHFLTAYPKEVVEIGIKTWRTGMLPEDIEGRITDIQLDESYSILPEDTRQFIREQSEDMSNILPLCGCGKKLNLMGVCGGCKKDNEGFKSKFVCSCGYEEYFKATVREKIEQLKEV